MYEALNSIVKVKALIGSSTSLKLLRARNLHLIITFLHQEFKMIDSIGVPYQHLLLKLTDFLESVEYRDEEALESGRIIGFDERAKIYLDKWIDDGYLRNLVDDTTKEPVVFLTTHTEKVFQVFELLREKEFVGTESKFRDIFNKLRDLVEKANPDQEKRLEELEKRKEEIEEEIRRIKIDSHITTYEDYQVKSGYEEANRLANELIGDFKEVEDNFKNITRKIYERQQQQDLTKGQLLEDTFDALYELKNTNQGKSFYAFWQFMLDDTRQEEFKKLTKEVYQVLEDRDIEMSSHSLRSLKSMLYMAARKVLDKNRLLADKLSREIMAKDQLESRKTRELMGNIRQLALLRLRQESNRETYLELDGVPNIYLPLERKLGERPEENAFSAIAKQGEVKITDLESLDKLHSPNLIDKKVLLANIYELLENRSQISLKEVVDVKKITKGLPELLAYVTLISTSPKFFINEESKENILFSDESGKYLELPQIIFSK